MKSITLILTLACAMVCFSSCCCQTQSAPPLRPMPGDCDTPEMPQQPIKVFKDKNGK